jgi:kinesin family protein 18/19
VRKNVLDVSYHVSQYQTIISELKGEIGRLKEKIQFEGGHPNGPPGSQGAKKAAMELQELRDQMVANFKDQMSIR